MKVKADALQDLSGVKDRRKVGEDLDNGLSKPSVASNFGLLNLLFYFLTLNECLAFYLLTLESLISLL
jgi:hypothetical protein